METLPLKEVTLLSSDSPSAPNNLGYYPSQDHDNSQGLSLHTPRPHCSLRCSLATCSGLDHDGEGHTLDYHVAFHHHN